MRVFGERFPQALGVRASALSVVPDLSGFDLEPIRLRGLTHMAPNRL